MIKNSGYAASVAATTAGVTLIELLVVLAIAAILLTVAIPSFTSLLAGNRLSGRTFDLAGAMNMARSEAIKRGTRVSICKTQQPEANPAACEAAAGWEQGWIVFVDNTHEAGNGLGSIDGNDAILRIVAADARMAISAGASFAAGMTYGRDGVGMGIKADGGMGTASNTFTLCLAGQSTQIITNRIGRIRIASGNC